MVRDCSGHRGYLNKKEKLVFTRRHILVHQNRLLTWKCVTKSTKQALIQSYVKIDWSFIPIHLSYVPVDKLLTSNLERIPQAPRPL